jgi:hypothetical protein
MKTIKIILLVLIYNASLIGQNIFEQQGDIQRLSPSEFGIPTSPVFDLMGVSPAQVVKTSDIKDFKVDWSFKSWSLSPNVSFEVQPIWELMYKRKPLKRYLTKSKFREQLFLFCFFNF